MDVPQAYFRKRLCKAILVVSGLIFIILFVLLAYHLIHMIGWEVRESAWKFLSAALKVWGVCFIIAWIYLGEAIYHFPQADKKKQCLQKVSAAVGILVMILLWILYFFLSPIALESKKPKEHTATYKGQTYVIESVPFSQAIGGQVYHKVLNGFLYEKKPAEDVIALEDATGVIQSQQLKARNAEQGEVLELLIDIGSGGTVSFTLTKGFSSVAGVKFFVGKTVWIEYECHPESNYRPIVSIEFLS